MGTERLAVTLRVLIVDDDPIILEVARAALAKLGHRVDTQMKAFGTTERIVRERPDVVLMDVNLPGLSGARLVELAAAREGVCSAFVLYSGIDSEELDALVRSVGAVAGISKSLGPAEFSRAFSEIAESLVVGSPTA